MMKRDVPVYLITGFLESGKTQFLDFTIHQSYFQIPDKTLLILCEEGEEEYDEESLKKMNTVIEIIEDPEDFNEDTLQMLNKKHQPGRVLVEYNPLWSVDKFYQTDMPRYWDLAQHIVTVDASTFQIYMNNMKSLFMEMIRNADLVIFNRCQDEHPLANFRRSVKVVNSRAEVVFENEEADKFRTNAFLELFVLGAGASCLRLENADRSPFRRERPSDQPGNDGEFCEGLPCGADRL